jgi:RNA polymerase sigma-70 factor, ECF subfamily
MAVNEKDPGNFAAPFVVSAGAQMNVDDNPLPWLREHGPKLLAFACQWADCQADAEDIFQEAFLRFWKSRDTAREPLLYLYRCVRNVAIDRARSHKRRLRHETEATEQTAQEKTAGPPDVLAEQSEMARGVQEALSKLPREQREAVVLRIWSDMTFHEISQVLSIPPSTAHALFGAAMRRLHVEMEEGMRP